MVLFYHIFNLKTNEIVVEDVITVSQTTDSTLKHKYNASLLFLKEKPRLPTRISSYFSSLALSSFSHFS